MSEKNNTDKLFGFSIIGIVVIVAIVGLISMSSINMSLKQNSAGEAFGRMQTNTNLEQYSRQSTQSGRSNIIPTGVECEFEAYANTLNQGMIHYRVWSDRSNPESDNRLDMKRKFSVVDRDLAEKYLILRDFGERKMGDVAFSMFEFYYCMIPDWLYDMLEGLYLVKYQADDTTRASVLVLKTREDAILVAKLLLALGEGHYEFQTINGNLVVHTTQEKGYWWIHDNQIIRIATHVAHDKDVRSKVKPMQSEEEQEHLQLCETLDSLDLLLQNQCIRDSFWYEVPEDILDAYLHKLPSDADEVNWDEPATLNGQEIDVNSLEWPTQEEAEEHQWGCDPELNHVINNAFASMQQSFSGDKEAQREKMLSHQDDLVKITDVQTDKRWYYLGEKVKITAKAVSLDGDMGTVIVDVDDNIFPHPEYTSYIMRKVRCYEREASDRGSVHDYK